MGIKIKHPKFKGEIKMHQQKSLKDEVHEANKRYHNLIDAKDNKINEIASERDRTFDKVLLAEKKKMKKRKHAIMRQIAVVVSFVCIVTVSVVTATPSRAKTVYEIKNGRNAVISGMLDVGIDAPEEYKRVEAKRMAEELAGVMELANSKLGCKYVHGAHGPNTFDCQGFVHYIFTHCVANVKCYVPTGGCRNQLNAIKKYQISTNPKDAKRGDIVYFYGSGRWKHVGIALGDGNLIHATTIGKGRSCVKITKMPDWYKKYAVVRVLG